MPTTVNPPQDGNNDAGPGLGYDGVVRVRTGDAFGTGALLLDGRAVLTAAHVVAGASTARLAVTFNTEEGEKTRQVSEFLLHPNYNDVDLTSDLALLWLAEPAPISAERYAVYRDDDEIGQTFTFVGYGETGTGETGSSADSNPEPKRFQAANRFETDAATLKAEPGIALDWDPLPGEQLIVDFDNGRVEHDALDQLMGIPGLGLGDQEGILAPGDSGGPAFLGGAIAGLASYGARVSKDGVNPDIDWLLNSSYGELGSWQRVSTHQQWLDQQIRAHLPKAPTTPAEVQHDITEGNDGTTLVYFLVSFNGRRSDPNAILSVDYATRDGTAHAGSDYLAVDGTLNLYPDERHAVIPVEVIGDYNAEPNETFHLDITNPVGGDFPGGAIVLTATRTIVDDDGWV